MTEKQTQAINSRAGVRCDDCGSVGVLCDNIDGDIVINGEAVVSCLPDYMDHGKRTLGWNRSASHILF